mgnify:FL=1
MTDSTVDKNLTKVFHLTKLELAYKVTLRGGISIQLLYSKREMRVIKLV